MADALRQRGCTGEGWPGLGLVEGVKQTREDAGADAGAVPEAALVIEDAFQRDHAVEEHRTPSDNLKGF